MSLKGLVSFAIGGVLLVFTLYIVFWGALSQSPSVGTLINGLAIGFVAFLLIGLGLFLIIESAVSSK